MLEHLVQLAERLHVIVKSKFTNRHLSDEVRDASTAVQFNLSQQSIVRFLTAPTAEQPSLGGVPEDDVDADGTSGDDDSDVSCVPVSTERASRGPDFGFMRESSRLALPSVPPSIVRPNVG